MLIRKEILRDKIHDLLKGWILDGTLKPGQHLIELNLARRLNVSRAPLREALWLLANQGLVQIRAHHGATVTQLSEESIREIFEVREILETHAAKKIRALRNPEIAARLEEALFALEEAASTRDMGRFSEADLKFHQALWKLAGNRLLHEVLEGVSARFFGYALIRDLPHAYEYRFDAIVNEHRKMVTAILEGTDSEIEAVFGQSFAEFRDYVLARFAEQPISEPAAEPESPEPAALVYEAV